MNDRTCPALLHEEDAEKYRGEYVIVSGEENGRVLCHGKDVVRAYEETQRMGYKDPAIIYVPENGEMFIYRQHTEGWLIDML